MKIFAEAPRLRTGSCFAETTAGSFPIVRPGSAKGASGSVFTAALDGGWRGEVFQRMDRIDPALWDLHLPTGWKDRSYFQTLEETFAGQFAQYYLLLYDETGRTRALQPFFLVEQDLTVSLAPVLRTLLKPLRSLLRPRLLMVGCIVGDGQIGIKLPGQVPLACPRLDEALSLFARHQQVGIILFKDFPAAYRPLLAPLTEDGLYTRLPSLPAVRLALDFTSFEEYLQDRLGKATRKSLRRKFREVDALADPVQLEVKNRISHEESLVLHALYERIALRGDVHFEVFSPEYFLRLGERMPDRARYFTWRWRGKVIAFSFCTVHGDTIYDNDLGMDEAAALPLHLYHLTFRDIVRWSLAQGLRHYHSSPFNYDPKLHLRMKLVPLDLYARHTSPLVNRLLHRFAPLASPVRQEPLLRRFSNASDL